MIETSSVPPWKSSEIFGNLQKSPKNVWKRSPYMYLGNNIGKSLEIFGKWLEIFRKSSKTLSLVCLYLCKLRLLVRYRVEHSKIKFISTRGHVISFIYIAHFIYLRGEKLNCKSVAKEISKPPFLAPEVQWAWASKFTVFVRFMFPLNVSSHAHI